MRASGAFRRSAGAGLLALMAGTVVGCTASPYPTFLGNTTEIAWCAWPTHVNLCLIARGAKSDTERYTDDNYGRSNHRDGNKANAFHHATWHSLMTKRMSNNPATAIGFGERHEALAPDIPYAKMDLHNNEVGAWVGAQAPNEQLSVQFNKGLADNAFLSQMSPVGGPAQALWYIRS